MRKFYLSSSVFQKALIETEPFKTWKKIEKFETWCLRETSNDIFPIKATEIEQQIRHRGHVPNEGDISKEITSKITEYFGSEFSNSLYVQLGGRLKNFQFDFSEIFSDENIINQAAITFRSEGTTVIFSNGFFSHLFLSRGEHYITNCQINNLHLQDPQGVELENCLVGNLDFGSGATGILILKNCIIQNVTISHPDQYRAISSLAEFQKTRFETEVENSSLFKNAQSYRFLRMNLERLENTILSNFMRVLEYRADRNKEPKFTQFINSIYDLCSEYGTNTTRTFKILLWLWVITIFILLSFDGVQLALEDSYYIGWKQSLVDSSFLQAIHLTLQSSFNFLSIFGSDNLVIATNIWIRAWLIFEGISSLFLFLMIIFGVRKRFKIS